MNERLTLDKLTNNKKAKIVSIAGGRGLVHRLYQMGLTPGTVVEMISNYGHGPLVIKARRVEIALGRGMASKIIVESVENQGENINEKD